MDLKKETWQFLLCVGIVWWENRFRNTVYMHGNQNIDNLFNTRSPHSACSILYWVLCNFDFSTSECERFRRLIKSLRGTIVYREDIH